MVRPRSYTEVEEIAILNAVLAHRKLLEDPKKKRFSHSDAWREKWDDIASTVDAYFGTSRGTKRIRGLYQQWKSAARKKYKSVEIDASTAEDFEATLSMSERILRKICPDIFPRVNNETITSTKRATNGGSDEVTYGEEEEASQPPANSKNGHKNSSDDCEGSEEKELEVADVPSKAPNAYDVFKKLIDRPSSGAEEDIDFSNPEPVKPDNSDLETLVLSLQSMIGLEAAIETTGTASIEKGSHKKMKDVDDIGLIEVIDDAEESVDGETSDFRSQDAGQSLTADGIKTFLVEPLNLSKDAPPAKNKAVTYQEELRDLGGMKKGEKSYTAVDNDGPSGVKEMDEEKMEVEANAEISNEGAAGESPENLTERPEAREVTVERDQTSVLNFEGANETFPELPVSKVVGKRKRAPRAKNAKKRKTAKGASVRV